MKVGGYSVPFLSIFLFFALGILFTEYCPSFLSINFIGFAFLVLLIIGGLIQRKFHEFKILYKIILSTTLFLLGCFAHAYHDNSKSPLFFNLNQEVDYTLVVVKRQVGSSVDFNKYYGELELVQKDGKNKSVQGGVVVYLPKADSNYYYLQDKILFHGSPAVLPSKRNPGEFNYKQYLSRNNIYFQIKGKAGFYKRVEEGKGARHYIDVLRKSIADKFDENMKNSGVAKALILGYKNDLSPDTLDAFQRTGSMHVLAVSGLHLGILFLFLSFLFKSKISSKVPKIFQFVIIVSVLWIFVFLSGASISVIRAAIMFTIIQFGFLLGSRGNVINSLFLSAFIVLLLFPRELFQVGFQLSYLAVLGIVVFHKFIDNWFNFSYKFLNYLWSIVAVSISAQLAIGLLSVYYFHSFPVLFPLSNIVVILFAGMELTLGFSFVVFSGIDLLAKPIAYCLDFLISYELLILKSIGAIPYSLVNNIYLSIQEFLLMYFVVLSLSYYFVSHRIRWLYLGLIGILMIGLFCIWESTEVSKQDKVVLFGTNDICLAYLKRDTAFVYLSDKVNKKAFAFYAEPYIRSSGCSVLVFLGEGRLYNSNLVSVKENGLLRIKNKYYQPFNIKFTANKIATQLVSKYQVPKFILWNKKKEFDAIFLSEDFYQGIVGNSKFQVVHDFNVI